MIPNRIITTYRSAYLFPPVFVDCMKRMKKLHPRWQHRFFSDPECKAFIEKRRPDLLELYEFYPRPVMRSDLFRVVAVHELGGFYLDLDIHLHERLDPLRNTGLVLTEEWKMSRENYEQRHRSELRDERDLLQTGNYGFAAEKGHWFLHEVIEEMIRRAETITPSTCTQDDVLFATGPDVFSTVYRRHRADLCSGVTMLRGTNAPREPKARFTGGEPWWFQFGKYGAHLMTSTWRKA